MMSFYIFFAGIHLIMLMLQNTLSIVESKNTPGAHHGTKCVKSLPVLIFSLVFIVLALWELILVLLQQSQVNFWTYWGPFYFYHNVKTVRFFDWILYGCAAFVQLLKICNFMSHKKGHSLYEQESKSHKMMACIGAIVALASFLLIVTNMYLCVYYQSIGDTVLIIYGAIQTMVMLPILHLMIIHQEAHGQKRHAYHVAVNNHAVTVEPNRNIMY
jgi:hypothetical protein